jgi:hypothetical protein
LLPWREPSEGSALAAVLAAVLWVIVSGWQIERDDTACSAAWGLKSNGKGTRDPQIDLDLEIVSPKVGL